MQLQYIGARYVPIFYKNSVDESTQWENNVVYEPLTWVTLQNGHMYLSKKEVPATIGSPADNIDYWLDIGSYNGYIEGIEEEIENIVEQLTPLQEGLSDVTEGLDNEISARTTADSTFSDLLTSTNNTISSNYNTLTHAISEEAQARIAADEVLSNRMDTFSSLPSGSTSGNAELVDIRNSFDGAVYNNAGDAVRAIGYRTNYFKDSVMNRRMYYADETIVTGKYVSALNGQEVANNDYVCTSYIPVGLARYIGISRGTSQFAYYDSKKEFLNGVTIVDGGHDFQEHYVPANAVYVRFSLWSGVDRNKAYYVRCDGKKPALDEFIVSTDTTTYPEFSSLRSAVGFGTSYKNATLLLKAGLYDLVSEFSTEIAASPTSQIGLLIGNGLHMIGEPGVQIEAKYNGNDQNVFNNFAPFHALNVNGGYTMENLFISSKNTRYCVHEEYSGADLDIRIKYKNCTMYQDNTGTGAMIDYYPQCIGAGTAKHSFVEVDNCTFYSKKAETDRTPLVSWHNANVAGAFSKIFIKNSLFLNKGTVGVGYYGPSTDPSIVNINNCSLGEEPYTWSIGDNVPENWSITQYLNEVRS